jgi:type IV pilus assembly protein PilF
MFVACLALTTLGCTPASGGSPQAQSPELQSQTELDLAQDLWLQRAEPRQALEHALKAISLDDENAEAHHLAALLFLDFCRRDPRQCQLEQAEDHARHAVELRKDFREAQNTLGVVLIHRKQYAHAVAVLKPLSEDILYQTPENAWGNLGWAYLELGQLDAALDALSRSVAVQPNFCVGHFRLGLARQKKQDYRGAVLAYSNALAVDNPRCKAMQEVYLSRAQALMQLSQLEAAKSDLVQCVAQDATTPTGQTCQALANGSK